jgi:hypothetical protein
MTCPICHRPQATATDEALWSAHQAGTPLPEGWPSEDAEHLCWYALHRSGCTPDEKSDAVAVAQRLIDEGADGAVLLVARAVVRLSAVLDAERGVKGLPGWVFDVLHQVWRDPDFPGRALDAMVFACHVGEFAISRHIGAVVETTLYPCADALDGMERAEGMILGASGR